jgi:hypothetical protein
MPRIVTHLDIFVASPSDLGSERDLFEKVCNELNLTIGRPNGVFLDLVRWETHTFPDFDAEPQAVINKQIGTSYDVFIGLLWGRFGTPTEAYESGTQEEYQRALARLRENPGSLHLMIYFKDAPIAPSKIDAEQLAAVQKFKASVPTDGGLYSQFKALEELESLIRVHLSRILTEFKGGRTEVASDGPPSAQQEPLGDGQYEEDVNDDNPEDIGLLDAIAEAEELFNQHSEALEQFNSKSGELSAVMASSSEKMRDDRLTLREKKTVIDRMADDMISYAKELRLSQDRVFEPLHRGINRTTAAVAVAKDFQERETDDLTSLRETAVTLRDTYSGVIDSCTEAAAAIEALPRITTRIAKAKRQVTDGLIDCAQAFESAQNLLDELLQSIDAAIST